METLSAISVAVLTVVISTFFLAYTQKEKLNKIYHYLGYLFIIGSIVWCSVLITLTCLTSMGCSHYRYSDGYHHSSTYYQDKDEKTCPKCSGMMKDKMNKQKSPDANKETMMQHMHADSMQMMNNR